MERTKSGSQSIHELAQAESKELRQSIPKIRAVKPHLPPLQSPINGNVSSSHHKVEIKIQENNRSHSPPIV